jgi:hypothetical protein
MKYEACVPKESWQSFVTNLQENRENRLEVALKHLNLELSFSLSYMIALVQEMCEAHESESVYL